MAANWWELPITQAHGENDEQGVDLGAPFHTPITAILGGVVQDVRCAVGWGCEVDIATQLGGQSFVEGFLHIDVPQVAVGQQLAAGDPIGLSGGEITALPGAQHVDDPRFSSGPHVEFDLWRGGQAWVNAIDPTSVLQAGPQVGAGGPSGPGGGIIGQLLALIPGLGKLANVSGQAAQGAQDAGALAQGVGLGAIGQGIEDLPANFGHAVAGGFSNLGNWIHDRAVPFGAANLVAIAVAVIVILVLLGPGDEGSSRPPAVLPVPV